MLELAFLLSLIGAVCGLALLGESRPLLYTTVVLTFCSDLVFVPLGELVQSPLGILGKSWREFFLITTLISYVIWRGQRKGGVQITFDILFMIVGLAAAAIIAVLVGLQTQSLFSVLNSSRNYFLPVALPLCLYLTGVFARDRIGLMYYLAFALAIGMAIYSTYLHFTFTGNISDLWYYDFVSGRKIEGNIEERLIAYQFTRDGALRAPGFLVSSVDYSILCGIIAMFALAVTLSNRGAPAKALPFLTTISCVAGIELSQTRAGYAVIILGLFIIIGLRILRIRSWIVFPAAMIGFVAITIISIRVSPSLFDSSMTGRPDQWIQALSSFKLLGWGFIAGENNGPTYKDSLYLSALGTFGVFSSLYIAVLILLYRKLTIVRTALLPRLDRSLILASISSFGAMWYIFGFHYTLGNASFYTLLLLSFGALGRTVGTHSRKTKSAIRGD